MRPPRGLVVGLVVGVALLLAALAAGRPGDDGPALDPRSDGPLGTSALVTLLRELGAGVELSAGLPDGDDDVALLLRDRLDVDQRGEVLDWVRRGGRLVVTDPSSSLLPTAIDASSNPFDPEPLVRGVCTVASLEAVETVAGGSAVRFDTQGAESTCLGSRDFAYVVVFQEGEGRLVGMGGAAALTNDALSSRDNAVLAAGLLVPTSGAVVRVVDAPIPAGGGDKTLGDLVPGGVRRLLIQLSVAFGFYALWRAIRLGRPVREDQPVEVAGSELVAATGRLLARGRDTSASAEVLREALRRDLGTRVGVPPSASPATLAEVVAARTGLPVEQVLAAVGDDPVATEAELIAVAQAVSSVHQEVLP